MNKYRTTTKKTIKLFSTTITIERPKKIKRIGANRQSLINSRKARFKAILESKAVVYTSYALFTLFALVGGYMMFVMAILLDPSNPYNK